MGVYILWIFENIIFLKNIFPIHIFAYLAKYTRDYFGYTIGRVTGLDAAGPLFEKTSKEVRIDKSDADFVDLIHTNGGDELDGMCGIHAAVGHADFYANGGGRQPGCAFYDAECHHMRATLIYVDSVNNGGCVFQACKQADYDSGNCNSCQSIECNSMGLYAHKPLSDTTYYGKTGDSEPYC